MNAENVAIKFFEWLIYMGYCGEEDFEDDIGEMMEDFSIMEKEVPRMFNLLRNISDM